LGHTAYLNFDNTGERLCCLDCKSFLSVLLSFLLAIKNQSICSLS